MADLPYWVFTRPHRKLIRVPKTVAAFAGVAGGGPWRGEVEVQKAFEDQLVALVAHQQPHTQPLQALEAPVEAGFKPLASALILLRENGVPSVFYADLFGASYEDTGGDGETYAIEMPVIEQLHELIDARQRFAHGVQTLWFDHPNCIAFSRSGTEEDPGCVVVLSNGDDGEKMLPLGENYRNKRWRDFLGNREEVIETDDEGNGIFTCNGGSVSVWVIEEVL